MATAGLLGGKGGRGAEFLYRKTGVEERIELAEIFVKSYRASVQGLAEQLSIFRFVSDGFFESIGLSSQRGGLLPQRLVVAAQLASARLGGFLGGLSHKFGGKIVAPPLPHGQGDADGEAVEVRSAFDFVDIADGKTRIPASSRG